MNRPLETPTTAEIRARYVGESWQERDGEEFDAWLVAHDAEVKAAALEEAAEVIEKWADAALEIRSGELWNPADVAEDLQVVAATLRRTATPEGADE